MQQEETLTTILSDLVRINNDRIDGYKEAIKATENMDLKALFQRMIDDSRLYAAQLNRELVDYGGFPVTVTSLSGELYRIWTNIKTAFTGYNRHAIFSSCEYGEDAIQRTYSEALSIDIAMPYSIRELIASQRARLRDAHDTIKTYRDIVNVVY
ncbi:MAG TPA: PA2169 family four-helix-bundle protein [Chitinophaga sp.]|uniref:ferritin-like domain-containing protein n=1 Tax=Chitinophaga sp. TaxID=1869181 RepID=UPI002C36E9DF|nr:PA2169 family four-helix-bundle protein [Chitinophaga sp.]HVI46289.1 PA2169 family four-helix-bundle protein [Chitinophaga sp.]